jgi:hypothetical protein
MRNRSAQFVPAFVVLAFVLPGGARAEVGVYPLTRVVPVGGVISGWGDGSAMDVYLVPASSGPRRSHCQANAICEPTSTPAPTRPFVFLGRLKKTQNLYTPQRFSFALPPRLRPGAYRMYLYCRPCGGSLIQSGNKLAGETIRLTARPNPRTIHVGPGLVRRRFLVSEPSGVTLLLRLTVPHGTRVFVSGTIPSLAGVGTSTERHANCRQSGAVDVCTQPEEWCPIPAAAWHFELTKVTGRPGTIRLAFVVGDPPANQ